MYSDEIISQEEHFNFIENLKKDNKNFYWIVYKDEEFIGVISLNDISFKNKNAYIGLYSNPFCDFSTSPTGSRNHLGMVKKQLQVFHFGNDSIIPFPQITIKNNIGNRNI